jgi:hypothetical protein
MREILLLCTCLITTLADACINLTQRVPGVLIEDVEFYRLGSVEIDNDSLQAYISKASVSCGNKLSRECNDLVIAHLFAKDFKTALGLSTRLVGKYPNDYSVVITHAAALELSGRPGDAIPFMKHALELNPKSHKCSEWIHVKFLEQRVTNAASVSPWALIGMDLRPDSLPEKPDSVDVKQLLRQVHYQVNDRRFFTPEKDPLYGALMFAYADLLQLNGYRNQAKWTYEQAAAYGFTYSKAQSPVPEQPRKVEPAPPPGQPVPATPPQPEQGNSNASLYSWLLIGAMMAGAGLFIWRNSRTP